MHRRERCAGGLCFGGYNEQNIDLVLELITKLHTPPLPAHFGFCFLRSAAEVVPKNRCPPPSALFCCHLLGHYAIEQSSSKATGPWLLIAVISEFFRQSEFLFKNALFYLKSPIKFLTLQPVLKPPLACLLAKRRVYLPLVSLGYHCGPSPSEAESQLRGHSSSSQASELQNHAGTFLHTNMLSSSSVTGHQ